MANVNVIWDDDNLDAKLEDYIDDGLAKMTKRLFSALVLATPRDTGRAQASWQFVQKGSSGAIIPPGIYSVPTMPTIPVSAFDIVNTVPYMKYLNYGHSRQAPTNFIEYTINQVANKKL